MNLEKPSSMQEQYLLEEEAIDKAFRAVSFANYQIGSRNLVNLPISKGDVKESSEWQAQLSIAMKILYNLKRECYDKCHKNEIAQNPSVPFTWSGKLGAEYTGD